MEHARMLFAVTASPVLAMLTPTKGFIMALVIMCGFNIWAGMRADGVVIHTCKNFSISKFGKALRELVLYLLIAELLYIVMYLCGDGNEGLYAVKSVTYVIMYVYLQNAFKNLVIAYPANRAIWIIYLIIRLEFKRAMPSHLTPLIEQYEKKIKDKEEKK